MLAIALSAWVGLTLGLTLGQRPVQGAESAGLQAHQVMAAQAYKVAMFIDWPGTAFAGAGDPFVFAVLGQDPFGGTLETILENRTIKNRPVVIKRFARIEDVAKCHILFISDSEEKKVPEILKTLRGRPILTVGGMPDFARRGGVVGFVLVGRNVKFELNRAASIAARLEVEARLQGNAIRILDEPLE